MNAFACPPPEPTTISLGAALCVGFGYVEVTRNGERIWQGDDWDVKLNRFEFMAREHPGDWRVHFEAPLSSSTYKRETDGTWRLVETGPGFA